MNLGNPRAYDSFEEFTRAVHDELPDEWDTTYDDIGIEKTGGEQAGFQRDDLYRWMLVQPNEGDWENEIVVYLPDEIDQIADRPGVPVRSIEDPDLYKVVDFLIEESPDYQGTFTYDE